MSKQQNQPPQILKLTQRSKGPSEAESRPPSSGGTLCNDDGQPKPKTAKSKSSGKSKKSKPKRVSGTSQKTSAAPNPAPTIEGEAIAAESASEGGFGFGLGKMQELADGFQKAQQIQAGAKQLQAELEKARIEAHDANQTIIYCCTGHHEPVSIAIQPEAIAGTTAADLSERVLAVMRQGYYCSASHLREKMQALLEPLNFPTPEVDVLTIEGVTAFVREG